MGETQKPEICDRLVRGTGMGAADLYYTIKAYCLQFEKPKAPKPKKPAESRAEAVQANEQARTLNKALQRLEAADPCRPGGKWEHQKICWR